MFPLVIILLDCGHAVLGAVFPLVIILLDCVPLRLLLLLALRPRGGLLLQQSPEPAFGALRSRTRTALSGGGNPLLCAPPPPCRRAKWRSSRRPPTTPRAYLCPVEGPSVPAGSQFLGLRRSIHRKGERTTSASAPLRPRARVFFFFLQQGPRPSGRSAPALTQRAGSNPLLCVPPLQEGQVGNQETPHNSTAEGLPLFSRGAVRASW
jgi:hypothetical protein